MNNTTVETDEVEIGQDSSYRLEGNKLYATDGKSHAVYTMDKDGRYFAKIGDNPVYECYCDGDAVGNGCYITSAGSSGLYCCCADKCTGAKPPGDLGHVTHCKWKKVKAGAVAQELLLKMELQSAQMDSLPEELAFDESGIRSYRQGELEFEEEGLYELEDLNGETIVYLKRTDRRVRCECECDHGDCVVEGGGSTIYCKSKSGTYCAMVPNGNPCDGCKWQWVKDTNK